MKKSSSQPKFLQLLTTLERKIFKEDPQQAQLLPPSWKSDLHEKLLHSQKRIQEAISLLKIIPKFEEQFSKKQINHALQQMKQKTDAYLYELLDLSEEMLLDIYTFGHRLLEKKHYRDAGNIFLFLTTLAPVIPIFWIALGKCEEHLENYEEASFSYSMGISENHLAAAINAANCFLKIGKEEEAKRLLERVLQEIEALPENQTTRTKIEQFLTHIS